MEIRRVSHVVAYIKSNYPLMDHRKFDVVKIGARIYIYAVDRENHLQRHMIYQGNLPAMNELAILKQSFERNVQEAIKKIGYYA